MIVDVRVTVGVKICIGVRVAVGIDVGVSEGALVYVLINVGSNVGVTNGDEKADPLHPVKAMRIRTNNKVIIFVIRLNLYSTISPKHYPATPGLCRADAIALIINN